MAAFNRSLKLHHTSRVTTTQQVNQYYRYYYYRQVSVRKGKGTPKVKISFGVRADPGLQAVSVRMTYTQLHDHLSKLCQSPALFEMIFLILRTNEVKIRIVNFREL